MEWFSFEYHPQGRLGNVGWGSRCGLWYTEESKCNRCRKYGRSRSHWIASGSQCYTSTARCCSWIELNRRWKRWWLELWNEHQYPWCRFYWFRIYRQALDFDWRNRRRFEYLESQWCRKCICIKGCSFSIYLWFESRIRCHLGNHKKRKSGQGKSKLLGRCALQHSYTDSGHGRFLSFCHLL